MCRVEKEAAEARLRAVLREAHSMKLDVERTGLEFSAAQTRVGEMRSKLRGAGLLYVSNR